MENINKQPPMGQICLYPNCEIPAKQSFSDKTGNSDLYYCDLHSKVVEEGSLYVIEMFDYPGFVLTENGLPKIFKSYPEAIEEMNDCQDGYILNFEAMEIQR